MKGKVQNFLGLLILILLILSAACSGDSSLEVETQVDQNEAKIDPTIVQASETPQSPIIFDKEIEIRFTAAPKRKTDALNRLTKQFNQIQPNIQVQVSRANFPAEINSLENIVGNADCFEWNWTFNNPSDWKQVMNIQPFLDADSEINEQSFFPATLNAFRQDGALMGIPGDADVYMMAYNKRLFDQAGIDYPHQDWTLDEFVATAVAITSDDGEEKIYGYVPNPHETADLIDFLGLQGVKLIDRSSDPATIDFSDSELVQTLKWYADLSLELGAKPNLLLDVKNDFGQGYEMHSELINGDRAGMWPFGKDPFSLFGHPDLAHIGLAPFPQGADGIDAVRISTGYHISSNSDAAQACWEWIKFLTAQETLSNDNIPARITTATSESVAERIGPELAQAKINALHKADSTISPPHHLFDDWIFMSLGILDTALVAVLSEQKNINEATNFAQDEFNTYRECIIENDLLYSSDLFQNLENCIKDANFNIVYGAPSILRLPK